MMPVPGLSKADMMFGNIKHMPKYEIVPDEFKNMNNPYVRFISDWFFCGATTQDMDRLTPKEGVDKRNALTAIRAILTSFAPKHEHKEAGAAYLLSQWFILEED